MARRAYDISIAEGFSYMARRTYDIYVAEDFFYMTELDTKLTTWRKTCIVCVRQLLAYLNDYDII